MGSAGAVAIFATMLGNAALFEGLLPMGTIFPAFVDFFVAGFTSL